VANDNALLSSDCGTEKVAGSVPVGHSLRGECLGTGTKTSNYVHWRLVVRSPNAIGDVTRAPKFYLGLVGEVAALVYVLFGYR
jgi:hypothetical protein